MWTIVWRIACSCMNSFSVRHADSQWNNGIQDTNTIDKYKQIVTSMFADEGRLLVLNTFTTDVGQEHPHITADVEEFKAFVISQYQ